MKQLLQAVQSIREKYDAIYKSNGGYFNIFNITNIATDEVRICRVIKELIDPNGSHYQGDTYLRLFVKYVLHMEQEFTNADYTTATVQRELLIKNDRRIDLFIEIGGKKIPIEVKIYAGDQSKQCQDYYNYAVNSKIFYLTLDGHMPSTESLGKLSKDAICPISFQSEIITWLNACLNTSATIRIGSIREVILQVIDVLKMLTGQSEEGITMDLQKLILSSTENMKNADILQKAVSQVEYNLKSKVLLALDSRVTKKFALKRLLNSLDFQQNSSSNFGISYFLANLSIPEQELWLRIQIDASGLYAGLAVTENHHGTPVIVTSTKELRSTITNGSLNGTLWWPAWRYLFDSEGNRPDFKTHNEAYYSLVDNTYFDRFIDTAMDDVEKVLQSLLPPYNNVIANPLGADENNAE